jgi:hypothetical protein
MYFGEDIPYPNRFNLQTDIMKLAREESTLAIPGWSS